MIKNISNLGDAALYCDFGEKVNKDINSNVIKYFKSIQEQNIKGITNLTPSYNKLIISYDIDLISYSEIKEKILKLKIPKTNEEKKETIKIPVCFDDEFSLDLKRLNKKLKLSKEQILETYLNKEYFCYMTGFIAGMPFVGDIHKDLQVERLETPRVKVPKGSVGITEQFCNIYTFESPGGWNIIGNTPVKVFDKFNEKKPTLINPGDKILFYEITKKEYLSWNDK